MASMALTASSLSTTGLRKINPVMEAADDKLHYISTVLLGKIRESFKKIAEKKPVNDRADTAMYTIQANQMEPLVKASIAVIEKESNQSREAFTIAAKVAREFYIRTHRDVICESDVEEDELEDNPDDVSEKWFMPIFRKAHHLFFQSFAEKILTIPKKWQDISCYDYALLAIGEQRGETANFSDFELPAYLKEWGYEVVEKPLPGDLVLFLDEGHPTHLGVCREKGLIQSKWGNRCKHAYLHKLENAPASYGAQIVYYRPPKR